MLIEETPTRLTSTDVTKRVQDRWPKLYPRSGNPDQTFTRSWTKESDKYRRQVDAYLRNLTARGILSKAEEQVKDELTGQTTWFKKRYVYYKTGRAPDVNLEYTAEEWVELVRVASRPTDEFEKHIVGEVSQFKVGTKTLGEWTRTAIHVCSQTMATPSLLAKFFPSVLPPERLHRLNVNLDDYITQIQGEIQSSAVIN